MLLQQSQLSRNNSSITSLSKYYTEDFKTLIEDHLNLLIKTATTVQLDPQLSYKFRYNFYGLLAARNVPKQEWWIYLRVNDMHSPSEWLGTTQAMLEPNDSRVSSLGNINRTVETELF